MPVLLSGLLPSTLEPISAQMRGSTNQISCPGPNGAFGPNARIFKRTDVDAYRLQSRGGKGVINMKANSKVGKVVSIQLVDDTTEMMVISQFGKIIRIDTKSVRPAVPPTFFRKV